MSTAIGSIVCSNRSKASSMGRGIVLAEVGDTYWICFIHVGILRVAKSSVNIVLPPSPRWLEIGLERAFDDFSDHLRLPDGSVVDEMIIREVKSKLLTIKLEFYNSDNASCSGNERHSENEGITCYDNAGHEIAMTKRGGYRSKRFPDIGLMGVGGKRR